MDSHLLAVSGVSSCSQRNQDESAETATRLAGDSSGNRRQDALRELFNALLPVSHTGPKLISISGRGVA